MKIIKKKISEYKYELILEANDESQVIISYAGGDLYWTMYGYHEDNSFSISKTENKEFFLRLQEIFNLIENVDKPYDKRLKDNCFEWISEAYGIPEEANKLTITKNIDSFTIKFFQNPNSMFNIKDVCPICFCLSGSRNQDIASAFSIMYQQCISTCASKSRILKQKETTNIQK